MKKLILLTLVALLLPVTVAHAAVVGGLNLRGLSLPKKAGEPIILNFQNATPADPAQLLQLYVGEYHPGQQAVAGKYRTGQGEVSFTPHYPLISGQNYLVRYRPESDADFQQKKFQLPAAEAVAPKVTAIYPAGDTLPENVLRFYIHFSTPMAPHQAFDHIKLVDDHGKVDKAAFMRFKQELWSPDHTRLTLLLDPGRIKRGLPTNDRLGPALHEGRRYSLVIDGGWMSAGSGQKLPRFANPFLVGAALRTLPDINRWQVMAPGLNSAEPLRITFDRPFDYELMRSKITVTGADGTPIHGRITGSDDGRSWLFYPVQRWHFDSVNIVVDSALEDVAGNNFRDLMDHPVEDGVKKPQKQTISVKLGQ